MKHFLPLEGAIKVKYSKNYMYTFTEILGQDLAFQPYSNRDEILYVGAFEGKYLNNCLMEFPAEHRIDRRSSIVRSGF